MSVLPDLQAPDGEGHTWRHDPEHCGICIAGEVAGEQPDVHAPYRRNERTVPYVSPLRNAHNHTGMMECPLDCPRWRP